MGDPRDGGHHRGTAGASDRGWKSLASFVGQSRLAALHTGRAAAYGADDLRVRADSLHRALYVYRRVVGRAGDGPVPVYSEDEHGDSAGVGGGNENRRHRRTDTAIADCQHGSGEDRRADGEPVEILPGFRVGHDHQRDVDDSAGFVCAVSRSAVVEFVVSGSGARRRGLRGAKNVQREGREEFACRDAVVQSGELRAAAVAMDFDRAGGVGALFSARRADTERGFCGEPAARVRDGAAGFSAAGVAWSNGGGIFGGVHVHHRDATELGNFIPGE